MGVLGTTGLWGVTLRVTRDGAEVDMPCLVDTGSPITVLNSAAAAALRVGPSAPAKAEPEGEKGLLGRLKSAFKPKATAGAVMGLAPAGVDLSLSVGPLKPASSSNISGAEAGSSGGEAHEASAPSSLSSSNDGVFVDMGSVSSAMVGDLPGFAALGVQPGQPAAVLGLDAFSCRTSVVVVPKESLLLL
uniref:Peptidase A2 domain-containing protein n=1 Tax=Chlamydomonas euryale TaxID=1486919 RepID=A0A6U2F9U3_9CHLO